MRTPGQHEQPELLWYRRASWRRAGGVLLGVGVLALTALMLGRVVVARVPQQRAVIERLFEQRTGLEVRFASMRVGWGWRGVRAVLTRVELAEPSGRRFRALAPEVQLNLDTWGIFRGGELSLGRVVLLAPDIEVIARREPTSSEPVSPRAAAAAPAETASWLRRLVDTVRSMPQGQFDVQAGTLRIVDARDGTARTMKVSQAVVRRDGDGVSGYGSVLLPELIGRSVFVSIELEGINTRPNAVDGELRVIGRGVSLTEFASDRGAQGQVTLDARGTVVAGEVVSGRWQANLRRVAFKSSGPTADPGDGVAWRFERVDMTGQLRRVARRLRIDIDNFYVAPEAGPGASAALSIVVDADTSASVVSSQVLPMPVARFLAAVASRGTPSAWPEELDRNSGELQQLRLTVRDAGDVAATFSLSAGIRGLAGEFPALRMSASDVSGTLTGESNHWSFEPAPGQPVTFSSREDGLADASAASEVVTLAGKIAMTGDHDHRTLQLDQLTVTSPRSTVTIDGTVGLESEGPVAIDVVTDGADAVATRDALARIAPDSTLVKALAPLRDGRVVRAELALRGTRTAVGEFRVKTDETRIAAQIAALVWRVDALDAELRESQGKLVLEGGATTLALVGGRIEDVALESARLELPANGAGRVAAKGSLHLDSPWLREKWPILATLHGSGAATVDLRASLDAAGAAVGQWRGTIRVGDAALTLPAPLPAINRLRGTLEFAEQRPTRSTLEGDWFGGTVQLALRQPTGDAVEGAPPILALRGIADAGELARALRISADARSAGEITWTGSLAPARDDQPAQLSVDSSLTGLESTLPAPYAKRAGQALPVTLQATLTDKGAVWSLQANREQRLTIDATAGALQVQMVLPGMIGSAKRLDEGDRRWTVALETLDVTRTPAILAAVRTLISAEQPWGVDLAVKDVRLDSKSLGPLAGRLLLERGAAQLESARMAALWRDGEMRGRCARACQLVWQLEADPADRLLDMLGLGLGVKAQRFVTDGSFSWPANERPSIAALSGDIALSLSDGILLARSATTIPVAWLAPAAITTGEPGSGSSDVSAFSALSAKLRIETGVAVLDRWQLQSAQGELGAHGRIDLVKRDYDLDVDWQRMSDTSSETAPTAEKSRLAAAWAALRNRLQGESAATPAPGPAPDGTPLAFRIVGDWDAPFVTPLSQQANE
ncbi:MAG: AsmA-like C-terminal region-containing protein [Steroidobacteraceae bacterium]